jgi:hypothetical protein
MSVTNDCIEGLDLLTTICIGNLYLFEGFKKKVLDSQEISLLCKRCKSSNSHTNERGAGYRLVRRNLLRLTIWIYHVTFIVYTRCTRWALAYAVDHDKGKNSTPTALITDLLHLAHCSSPPPHGGGYLPPRRSPSGDSAPGWKLWHPLRTYHSDPPTPELPEEKGLILPTEDSHCSFSPCIPFAASPIDLRAGQHGSRRPASPS